jgi:hypothetical protein
MIAVFMVLFFLFFQIAAARRTRLQRCSSLRHVPDE